MALKAR